MSNANFTPSVFIGIGGVGKNILLRMRRMIIENHKALENLPSIRFLHVDTATSLMPDSGSSGIPMQVMGQPLLFNDSERCVLSQRVMQEMNQGVETIKNNPAVMEWFDNSLPLDANFTEGAGGIRPYGRLAFHYSVDLFRDKLAQAVKIVKSPDNMQKTFEHLNMNADNSKVNFYIVCSLLGGTGSGSFLEVCYNTTLVGQQESVSPYLMGTFVIGGNVDERRKANCYSALMELEYHSTAFIKGEPQHFSVSYPLPGAKNISESSAPVNFCYLVSHAGEGGYLLDRNELEEAVALNLFMEFGSAISGEKQQRRVDFTSTPDFKKPDEELGRSMQFATFGISVLEFPAPRIQDMMAHQLAAIALHGWLREETHEKADLETDIREVREKLKEEQLINKDLMTYDGKNILQTSRQNLETHATDVAKLIDEPRLDVNTIRQKVKDHIDATIDNVKFSSDPQQCGEKASNIAKKAYQKQKELIITIISKANALIENEHRGPGEASAYLNAVAKLIRDHIKSFDGQCASRQSNADAAQKPVFTGFSKFQEELGKEKYAMHYHNKKIHTEFLSNFIMHSLYREAFRAAREMLKTDRMESGTVVPCLLTVVEHLSKLIDDYIASLKTAAADLNAKADDIQKTIINTPIAQGIKLTEQRLKEIAKSVVPNSLEHITRLMVIIKSEFSEKEKDGNISIEAKILPLVLNRKDELLSMLVQKCSEICKGVRGQSVATEIKDKANLTEILSQKINFSKPMLQCAGFKGREKIDLYWLATSEPKGDLKTVTDAIGNIRQYNDMRSRHLQTLDDPYRIIFASEKGVFPLRRISLLHEYQKDYRLLQPPHTDLRKKYPDILPCTQEDRIRERTATAALLGKVFGLLDEKADPVTQYTAIELSYFDDSSRAMIHNKIAENWSSAEEKLAADQIQKEINKNITNETHLDLLEKLIDKRAKILKTKPEREKEWTMLQEYLVKVSSSLEGEDRNPEYQRQLSIVQQYRSNYGLTAPAQPSAIQQPQTPPAALRPAASTPVVDNDSGKADKFKEALRTHFAKGIKDKEKNITYGMKLLSLSRDAASAIFDEMISSLQDLDIEKRLEEYRTSFEFAILDDEITPEERKQLKEKQKELNLTDDEVRSIEEQFAKTVYIDLLQTLLLDDVIDAAERSKLKEVQKLLNLNDEQIKKIEADFSFEEVH